MMDLVLINLLQFNHAAEKDMVKIGEQSKTYINTMPSSSSKQD